MMTLYLVLLTALQVIHSDESETSWTEPVTGIKFLYFHSGTFVMGSPSTEEGPQQFAETQHPE